MSAFSNILHRKVKGDVQGIVFYALLLDRYLVLANLKVWILESVSGRKKGYRNISDEELCLL